MVYIVKAYPKSGLTWVYHWAVLVDDGVKKVVYHNSFSNLLNKYGGSVVKEDWSEFIKRYVPAKYYKTDVSESDVLKKTDQVKDEVYDKVFFNCHTYVKAIYSNIPPAQESYFIVAGIGIIIALVLLSRRRK